ncbi:hypothetical protein QK336_15155, partial [Pseudomonas aeruginosa]|nr:hypothetical protein [Pseudomonas aeruginosa]
HLLHRKALRVKSADFAKSGSLFQSFPRVLRGAMVVPLGQGATPARRETLHRIPNSRQKSPIANTQST